jgi:hypothetical protein
VTSLNVEAISASIFNLPSSGEGYTCCVGWVQRGRFGIATEGGHSGVLDFGFKVPVYLVSVHKNKFPLKHLSNYP